MLFELAQGCIKEIGILSMKNLLDPGKAGIPRTSSTLKTTVIKLFNLAGTHRQEQDRPYHYEESEYIANFPRTVTARYIFFFISG